MRIQLPVLDVFCPASARPDRELQECHANGFPTLPADTAAIALPMSEGVSLRRLRDNVRSDGTLAYLEIDLAGVPLEIQAYDQILTTLGVGGYRDPKHPQARQVEYGDGSTTRTSAVMDERTGHSRGARLVSPIHWTSVMYLHASHRGLTSDPVFADNVLALLLESPPTTSSRVHPDAPNNKGRR